MVPCRDPWRQEAGPTGKLPGTQAALTGLQDAPGPGADAVVRAVDPRVGPRRPADVRQRSENMSSIFYIIGVIVVIVFILSFLGLR
jgi:hypothetical protein